MFFNLLSFADMLKDVTTYFTNVDGLTNTCRTVMLWVAVALVAAFIVCKIAVRKDKQSIVDKAGLFTALGYTVASIVLFTVCNFIEDDMVAITFYPLLVFILAIIGGALAISFKPTKPVKIVAACVAGAALIAAIVCMAVYYASGDANEWNWIDADDVNNIGLYISAVALVAVIVGLMYATDKNYSPFDARSLSFAAVCVALSFALSYVRIVKMPMGGSITLASMLPIMLYAFMFGSRKGVAAGLVYGVLQAVQDPWILHPAQFALDYAVAFSALGLAGCLKGLNIFNGKIRLQFTLGAVIAGILRFVSHYFSGVFAFGSYASGFAEEFNMPSLTNPYFYSFVYQSMYVIPEIIIVIVVGVLLLSSKNFAKQVEKFSLPKAEKKSETPQ